MHLEAATRDQQDNNQTQDQLAAVVEACDKPIPGRADLCTAREKKSDDDCRRNGHQATTREGGQKQKHGQDQKSWFQPFETCHANAGEERGEKPGKIQS